VKSLSLYESYEQFLKKRYNSSSRRYPEDQQEKTQTDVVQ